VNANASPAFTAVVDHDVDRQFHAARGRPLARTDDAPEGTRARVAEEGFRTDREYGRHPAPFSAQAGVANRENRTMNAVELPALQPSGPTLPVDAGALQLSEGDHAVLASCDPSGDFVGVAEFCMHGYA
jgi:hypothetical protein